MNSPRPTRQNVAGRAYLDIQNLARQQQRPTDELHQLYALEGFLARLATSPHRGDLVLKGGVLLAAYDTRRPTRDIDMLARKTSNRLADVQRLVCKIADIQVEDGLIFATGEATAEIIRDEDEYQGIRVSLTATLAKARLHLHIDVNVGDPIRPGPRSVMLPRLLGGAIELSGYPLPMVLAEKIVTAVQRGAANTRWRDFADVYLLTRRHHLMGSELCDAVGTVADHREVGLTPLSEALDGYATPAQPRWSAWRRRQRLDDRLPEPFTEVVDAVTDFADPVLTGDVANLAWLPEVRSWR